MNNHKQAAWKAKGTHGKEKRAGANTARKRELVRELEQRISEMLERRRRSVAETLGVKI